MNRYKIFLYVCMLILLIHQIDAGVCSSACGMAGLSGPWAYAMCMAACIVTCAAPASLVGGGTIPGCI